MMKANAAIYARFSTGLQSETSITDQVRVCTEYAQREGMTVIEKYEDHAISGAAFGNRPAFLQMRAAADAGQFDVLIVMDTGRLARSQDLAPLVDRLRFQGVRVIGVQDHFDSANGAADMQAGLSGIMSVEFRKMVKARTHAALESRAKQQRPTGGKCYGYDGGQVDPEQAAIVREIFERYVDGASCRAIAKELNARGIPSPGSSWNRRGRRCSGWMASGIRAMIRNERYTGLIRWNTSEWRKDPDSGKRIRYQRPRSEWCEYRDESLRIIPDAVFDKARQRTRDTSNPDGRLKSGGKARYLLSGLLRCAECGAHYIIGDATHYVCSGYLGGDCSNKVRVRRDRMQDAILGPIREDLLAPERVERMAREMRRMFTERAREQAARAEAVPAELQAITGRIERLRDRLTAGDPDLEPDEIQAAIDRAEEKRRELVEAQPAAKRSAKLLAALPKAADAYRRQIAQGLENDPRAAGKARALLRKLLGTVRLVPEDGGLWAEFELRPGALLRATGTTGSGGRI